jgi:hypothetical protein
MREPGINESDVRPQALLGFVLVAQPRCAVSRSLISWLHQESTGTRPGSSCRIAVSTRSFEFMRLLRPVLPGPAVPPRSRSGLSRVKSSLPSGPVGSAPDFARRADHSSPRRGSKLIERCHREHSPERVRFADRSRMALSRHLISHSAEKFDRQDRKDRKDSPTLIISEQSPG